VCKFDLANITAECHQSLSGVELDHVVTKNRLYVKWTCKSYVLKGKLTEHIILLSLINIVFINALN